MRRIALRSPHCVLIRRNGEYPRKRKYPQIPAKRPSQNGSNASILKRRSSEMNELWPSGSKRMIWSLRRRTVRSARGIFRPAHVRAKNESDPFRICGCELCEALLNMLKRFRCQMQRNLFYCPAIVRRRRPGSAGGFPAPPGCGRPHGRWASSRGRRRGRRCPRAGRS